MVLAGFSNFNSIGATIKAKYIVINGIKVDKDYENFVPETFGRLTTIGPRFRLPCGDKGQYKTHQVCQCSCGSVLVCYTNALMTSNTTSCGCYKTENTSKTHKIHGMTNSTEHGIWKGLIKRCANVACKGFMLYGGRGIRVCDRWLEPNGQGFINFIEDMGPRPGPEYTVDRYPNRNGNYEPGNCRWATRTEQNRNRRDNRMLTAFGKTQCLAAWAEEYKIPYKRLQTRIKRGWSIERALTTLPKKS